uniref:Fibronectin type-III domain-containing protein n=1 Tax=Amphimedon queenslandica TaxID=400682 RepID=A0A1X7TGV9_AMPQE
MVIFAIAFLALLYFVEGTPQFTTCPSSVCLSQPVTYECNSGVNTLIWRVLDTNGGSVGTESYTDFEDDVGATVSIGSQFDTVLTVDGSSLVSNITFTPMLNISNYIVQCADPTGTFMNCSIVIADIPIVNMSDSFNYRKPPSEYVQVNWLLPNNPCISHYIVIRTSSTDSVNFTTTTNEGLLRLPLPSLNDTLYTFGVLAVDTGGRSFHTPFNNVTFIPNVPGFVTDLMLTQVDYPTDINDTVNITVSWNPPPQLSQEPILLRYNVHYNVSDVPQNITVPHYHGATPTTRPYLRTLSGFIVGSVYTVGVAAVNNIGTGSITSTTITILATPPPPEIPSTSTSYYSLTSGISSTPSTTEITPSVSVTE